MVEARGGRVIWTGRPEHVLIGDPDADAWDLVALVSYPSRSAFIDMVTSPSYESAHTHRERGLDRTVLLACEPVYWTLLRATGRRMPEPDPPSGRARRRNILFITTDQQRYDSLGCNGGTVARTPVVDRLGRRGHQLPAGLQPEHGVHAGTLDHADGPVRPDARRGGQRHPPPGRRALGGAVPARRRRATAPRCWARRTSSPASTRRTSSRRTPGSPGATPVPWRGFERSEQAMHAAAWGDHPIAHYGRWLKEQPPRAPAQLRRPAPGRAGRRHRGAGDEEQPDPAGVVPHRLGGRPHRRLAVVARRRRALVLLDVLPRPAPPVGPAGLRAGPGALAGPRPAARAIPAPTRRSAQGARRASRRTGSATGTARFPNMEGGPATFVPSTADERPDPRGQRQDARDERADRRGVRPGARRRSRRGAGWTDTDVIFTTDHGEMQGDFGLLYKGPYHTDALMRLPFVWRPAPSAGIAPAVVSDPVGQVDLAPTFCAIAGRRARRPGCRAGRSRGPTASRAASACCASGTASSPATACTCGPSTATAGCAPSTSRPPPGSPTGWRRSGATASSALPRRLRAVGAPARAAWRIATGELYNVDDGPVPVREPVGRPVPRRAQRDDLVADLYASLPAEVRHLKVVAPGLTVRRPWRASPARWPPSRW